MTRIGVAGFVIPRRMLVTDRAVYSRKQILLYVGEIGIFMLVVCDPLKG